MLSELSIMNDYDKKETFLKINNFYYKYIIFE